MIIKNNWNIELLQEMFNKNESISLQVWENIEDETIWQFINEKILLHKGNIEIHLQDVMREGIWHNNISFLKYLPSLKMINIDDIMLDDNDLKILAELKNLTSISIGNTKKKLSLEFIKYFEHISALNIYCKVENYDFIKSLHNLVELRINPSSVFDFDLTKKLNKLEKLTLIRGSYLNWELLTEINSLESLEMYSIKGLKNIDFISEMENMVELHLNNINELSSLPSFKKCKSLKTLYFDKMKSIQDFSPIKECQNLEEFMFYDNFHLKPDSFRFLQEMKQLKIALLSFPSDKQHDIYAKMMHEVFEEGSIILSNAELGRYRQPRQPYWV